MCKWHIKYIPGNIELYIRIYRFIKSAFTDTINDIISTKCAARIFGWKHIELSYYFVHVYTGFVYMICEMRLSHIILTQPVTPCHIICRRERWRCMPLMLLVVNIGMVNILKFIALNAGLSKFEKECENMAGTQINRVFSKKDDCVCQPSLQNIAI